MKTRLLCIVLFISFFAFGQIPTNGLQRAYDFTNGSLTDTVNSSNFTQNGTNLIIDNDRFGTSSNSISLNGDYLNSSTFSFTDISFSFWIKTNVIDSNERTIFDKSERTSANFSSANDFKNGFFIYLKNGRIGLKSSRRVVANNNTGAQANFLGDRFFSEVIADGSWKHIVITIKKEATQFNTSSGRNTYPYTYNYYVNNQLSQTSTENVNVGGIFTGRDLDRPVDLKIANIGNGMLTSTQIYQDNIDDIYIYNRVISPTEVSQIATNQGFVFCVPPATSNFSLSNIDFSSATLNISQIGDYDIAYGLSADAFNTYTIVNNITQNSFEILALNTSTSYNIQFRNNCTNANTPVSDWSTAVQFTTSSPPVYVNVNATGNNNGTNWADAYTNFATALANNPNSDFWLASGTYKFTTSESSSFVLSDNQKVYGGFVGNETSLSERDPKANQVIISGDRAGNDANGFIDFANNNLTENTHRLMWISGENTVIDGLTISGGFADDNSSVFLRSGSAVFVTETVKNFKINNVIFERNVAVDAGVIYAPQNNAQTGNYNYVISNCIFRNNLARFATVYYASNPRTNGVVTTKFINCLFYDNKVTDVLMYPTTGGNSAGINTLFWFRADVASTNNGEFINCTITNNNFSGSSANATGVISASRISGSTNISVFNSIFKGNFTSNSISVEKLAVNRFGTQSPPNSVIARNSFDPDNFSNWTDKQNINSANPSFKDEANDDYALTSGSPAIDFGDNALVPIDILFDIVDNNRFINNSVDAGAFEFNPTLSNDDLKTSQNQIKLYPNPTTSILNIEMNSKFKHASIYNIFGSEILKVDSSKINVSNLNKGVYLIKIEDVEGAILTKRFVKN